MHPQLAGWVLCALLSWAPLSHSRERNTTMGGKRRSAHPVQWKPAMSLAEIRRDHPPRMSSVGWVDGSSSLTPPSHLLSLQQGLFLPPQECSERVLWAVPIAPVPQPSKTRYPVSSCSTHCTLTISCHFPPPPVAFLSFTEICRRLPLASDLRQDPKAASCSFGFCCHWLSFPPVFLKGAGFLAALNWA